MPVRKIAATLAEVVRSPRQEGPLLPEWIKAWRYRSTIEGQFPLVSFAARSYLESYLAQLNGQAMVFEYGSGGSTLWFSRRSKNVVSIEHDPEWYEVVRRKLDKEGLVNVELHLVPPLLASNNHPTNSSTKTAYGSVHGGNYEQYVRSIAPYADETFDLVIVDGRSRAACLLQAAPKVKRGGILMLDDADRERYKPALESLREWQSLTLGGLRPLAHPNITMFLTRPE